MPPRNNGIESEQFKYVDLNVRILVGKNRVAAKRNQRGLMAIYTAIDSLKLLNELLAAPNLALNDRINFDYQIRKQNHP
jgi:hypothetical protein